MDDLRQYVVFAQTASAGSMSAAARKLRMTPSAVSQTVRALEARTGVILFHRSTRKLALTEAGERCLPHCLRMLDAGNAAAASLEQARDAPSGELRIAAPLGFAPHVAPALAPVLSDWPNLKLRLIVDDRLIDLIDARIDIALRVGELADSSWIGRKLCEFERVLCASPLYLERRGMPAAPPDLRDHYWLGTEGSQAGMPASGRIDPQSELQVVDLVNAAGVSERLHQTVRIVTTSQVALEQLCEQGMGIAVLFYADVRPALERGALVRLLPGWRLPASPVTMITRRREGEAAKVRVASEALKRYFARLPTMD